MIKICFIGPESPHLDRWINYFKNIKDFKVIYIKYPKYKNIFQYLWDILRVCFKYIKIKKEVNIFNIHYLGNFAFFLSLFSNKNVIFTAWGSDILIAPKNKFRRSMLKQTLKKAEIITSDTEKLLHILNEKYNISQDKLKLVRFGTNTNKWKKLNCSADSKFGITVVSLRNLEPIYDINTLILAANEVVKENKNVGFYIYGDGSERQNLEKQIIDLKLQKNVFLLGRYTEDQIIKKLANTDLYVSTSKSDGGLAASTAEAMACEVIPIVTDFGDNNYWVTKNNGFLFKIGDYKRLSEHIINYSNNKQKYKLYGKKSREKIVNELSYIKEMQKLEKLFKEVKNE